MSTKGQANKPIDGRPSVAPNAQTPISEPLSALEAHLVNAEAVERTPETSEAVITAQPCGRIETETRRISDEVTQRVQERRQTQHRAHGLGHGPSHGSADLSGSAGNDGSPAGGAPKAAGPAGTAGSTPAAPASAVTPAPRALPGAFNFKHLLVPLDGGFYAERALPYATAFARLTGASITLGHVSALPSPALAQMARRVAERAVGGGDEPRAADMDTYFEAERVLQAFHAPAVSVETLEDTDTVFGLRQLAEQSTIDAIALATHARQGIERQVLGSTVDGLVEQSHLPLLVIPPNVVVPAEPPSFAHILVPLDGSQVAEYALGMVVGLLQAAAIPDVASWAVTNWQITVLTVTESRALRTGARAYLDEVEARLRVLLAGVRISKRVLLGSAPGAIVDVADHGYRSGEVITGPFDVLAMATHGRGGLGRFLYGSVARYVLPRVAVPILLVHPTDTGV